MINCTGSRSEAIGSSGCCCLPLLLSPLLINSPPNLRRRLKHTKKKQLKLDWNANKTPLSKSSAIWTPVIFSIYQKKIGGKYHSLLFRPLRLAFSPLNDQGKEMRQRPREVMNVLRRGVGRETVGNGPGLL